MSVKGFNIEGTIHKYDFNALENIPDNIGTFWATYGVTTSNEIINAITNNKLVALNYENHIYYLSSILDIAPTNIYLFRSEDNVANYQIMMSDSGWQQVRVLNWIQPSSESPLPLLEDGVSSPGTSEKYSRGDHQHPMPEMNLGIDQNDGLLYFYINNNKHGNGIPISGGSESRLTEAVKLALLQLASKVSYIDEHGEDYYQDLYEALYSNFFNVIYTLEGCSSSNTDLVVKEREKYVTTISANKGYSLTGATVSITMGGADMTGAYSNGAINIPNVTGDLVITVRAVSTVSSISAVYTPSGTVYFGALLDDLKPDLVVTGTSTGGTTITIPAEDYILSGDLLVGTNTITVSYGGKSDTFDVTVSLFIPDGYVTDGLTFFLDAKHGANGTKWTDLISNKVFNLTNCDFGDNCVIFDGTAYGEYSGRVSSNWRTETIEVCYERTDTISDKTILSQPYIDNAVGSSLRFGAVNNNTSTIAMALDNVNRYYPRGTMPAINTLCSTSVYSSGNESVAVVNGVSSTNKTWTYFSKNNTNNTYLGANRFSTDGDIGGYYIGKIYAIRIYNRILTDEEILANQQNDAVYYAS